jgi:tetratricopeptide (TPR) repeat protein
MLLPVYLNAMKQLTILLILVCNAVFSQKMASDYFKEADTYFEQQNYGKALEGFQYIVEHYPQNELYDQSYFNVGHIYYLQKNQRKAIPFLKTMLDDHFIEARKNGSNSRADIYAHYRHAASEMLSELYYQDKKYDLALHYLALSDTTYPYRHFCGNAYAVNDVSTALRYSAIYQKLGKADKAIEKLLPTVFITLSDNSEVMQELKKLLAGKKELKQQLEEALKQIYPKTSGSGYRSYYFLFLNVEIEVPANYEDDEQTIDTVKTMEAIKQSPFYNMLAQL